LQFESASSRHGGSPERFCGRADSIAVRIRNRLITDPLVGWGEIPIRPEAGGWRSGVARSRLCENRASAFPAVGRWSRASGLSYHPATAAAPPTMVNICHPTRFESVASRKEIHL
jgi:hypothetical protein